MPENKIAMLLNGTCDAHVSVGTVVGYLKKAAELFGDEYERVKGEMREARICNYDETGQRVNGENRWSGRSSRKKPLSSSRERTGVRGWW